ncbi:MAG TPA: PDZ domain-containing protein, partial [Candidatus Brocadiia bacterium]
TAYVADGLSGLQIINVSNPAKPTLLGSYDTPGSALGVYVSGTTAYVADGLSGLQIINVSNPAYPARLSYDTPGSAWGVYVSGTTAYVADWESGLQIINVSNPAAPVRLGSYDTPGFAAGVYVSGTTAYVADGLSGLQIINVSNPAAPARLGSYKTPDKALGVYVSGTTAYVADRESGLQIIDVSSCTGGVGTTNTRGQESPSEDKERITSKSAEEYYKQGNTYKNSGRANPDIEIKPKKPAVRQPSTPKEVGVTVQNLTPEAAKRHGYEGEKGVVVSSVETGSPGALADLREGDLIMEVNREKIDSVDDFRKALAKSGTDKDILMLVRRGEYPRYVIIKAKKRI